MLSYVLRRLLWMLPTLGVILAINFAVLRFQDDGLRTDQGGTAEQGHDPKLIATAVRALILRQRRVGNDLPALLNFRGFTDKADAIAMLEACERRPGRRESDCRKAEERVWLYGRFLVRPLAEILDDPKLLRLHGPASFALSVCGYTPLNEELLDSLSVAEQKVLLERNDAVGELVIAHRNIPPPDDGAAEPHGFLTDADDAAAKRPLIASFWREYGDGFRTSVGERWGSIVSETGFVTFFGKLFTGELYSFQRQRYVFDLIAERWSISFWLQFLSIAIAWLVAVPLGIRSARRKGTLEDRATTSGLFLAWSLPEIFVGSLLLAYLCTSRASGGAAPFPNLGLPEADSVWMSTPRYLLDLLHHGFLPLLCLTYASFTVISRYMRGNLLDQFSADYVRTAKAKGASADRVVYRHAVPNSLITLITVGSGTLAELFGGFVVVESILRINGLGLLTLEAAVARDAPLVMGSVIISVGLLLVSILIADLLYAVADPRIRSRYA